MGMKRLLTLLLRVAQHCAVNGQNVRLSLARSEGVELTVEVPGCQCENEKDGLRLPPDEQGGLRQIERDAARWLVCQSGGHFEVNSKFAGSDPQGTLGQGLIKVVVGHSPVEFAAVAPIAVTGGCRRHLPLSAAATAPSGVQVHRESVP